MKKTSQPKISEVKRFWHLVDAKDKVLGRLASEVSGLLMGKNKLDYVPHLDMGDYVVILNVEKIKVTGNKADQKTYYSHSGYPGGLKEIIFKDLKQKRPKEIIKLAVKGMLPKNRLRSPRMKRLRLVVGDTNKYKDKFVNVNGKKN